MIHAVPLKSKRFCDLENSVDMSGTLMNGLHFTRNLLVVLLTLTLRAIYPCVEAALADS